MASLLSGPVAVTRTVSLLLLLACSAEPQPPEPELDAAAAEAAAEALLASAPARPDGDAARPPTAAEPSAEVETQGASMSAPARVELQWTGIGPLHKGFFSDREAVTRLAADLAGEVRDPVPIAVRYDSKNFFGQVRLLLDPEALLRPVAASGDTVRLQDLSPLTEALASYRSDVAGRFDVRLGSFEVGIESVRTGRACVFRLAGPPPPDGRLISPCVEVNGKQHCGTPTAEGVRFSNGVAEDVTACLDLSR